eukprot:TRINITY_DN193_c4_g4_i1.p1 TRINITY_DN193_c4_g4~~TRINITY_DN193_c4_g4_i1.p1  ORF type:complete len:419 (+),score=62.44 TRINITY_DN193_c4_g4_i1:82-1257(+)
MARYSIDLLAGWVENLRISTDPDTKTLKKYHQKFAEDKHKDDAPTINHETMTAFQKYYSGTSESVYLWWQRTKELGLRWDDTTVEDHTKRASRIADDLDSLKKCRAGPYNVMLLDGKGRIVWCIINSLVNKHRWDPADIDELNFIVPDLDENMHRYHELGLPKGAAINKNINAKDVTDKRLDVLYFNFSKLELPNGDAVDSSLTDACNVLAKARNTAQYQKGKNVNLRVYLSVPGTRGGAAYNPAKVLRWFDLVDQEDERDKQLCSDVVDHFFPREQNRNARILRELQVMLDSTRLSEYKKLRESILQRFTITDRTTFFTFSVHPRRTEDEPLFCRTSGVSKKDPMERILSNQPGDKNYVLLRVLLTVAYCPADQHPFRQEFSSLKAVLSP